MDLDAEQCPWPGLAEELVAVEHASRGRSAAKGPPDDAIALGILGREVGLHSPGHSIINWHGAMWAGEGEFFLGTGRKPWGHPGCGGGGADLALS